jgi:hypothetical protein
MTRRFGVETCERLAVGLVPVPEDQALCRESRKHRERLTDLGFIGLQGFTLLTSNDCHFHPLLLNGLRKHWRQPF